MTNEPANPHADAMHEVDEALMAMTALWIDLVGLREMMDEMQPISPLVPIHCKRVSAALQEIAEEADPPWADDMLRLKCDQMLNASIVTSKDMEELE